MVNIKITMTDENFVKWKEYLEKEGYVTPNASNSWIVTSAIEVSEGKVEYVEVNCD